MKLSDAIALGRMTVPKLIAGQLEGCALGMACNAAGITTKYHGLEETWPWLKRRIKFPAHSRFAGEETFGINVIFCMFDQEVMQDSMTLDQLIDWVRSVEPAETPTEQVQPETIAETVQS